jgi:hypothetical protein
MVHWCQFSGGVLTESGYVAPKTLKYDRTATIQKLVMNLDRHNDRTHQLTGLFAIVQLGLIGIDDLIQDDKQHGMAQQLLLSLKNLNELVFGLKQDDIIE